MTLVEISIFDCIEKFKKHCLQSKNWKVYEDADLIQANNRFHKFVWVQHLRPLTFRSMVRNPLCAVSEGVFYRTKNVSFMAFVLPQPPSAEILKFFEEEPSLQRWVAIYDLGRVFGSTPVCAKLNTTKSPVFNEFERYLSESYGIRFEKFSLGSLKL